MRINIPKKLILGFMSLYLLSFLFPTYAQTSDLLPDERNTIIIFKSVSPYVVNVHKLKAVINPYFDVYHIRTGVGSGILWGDKGYVVTNYHVIHGASKVAVTLRKGATVVAKIVGVAPHRDIAVLQITNRKVLNSIRFLKPLKLADSSKLMVGQKAIAIGNPFGLQHTLTTGVISALNRVIPSPVGGKLRGMIQTDASINPGNSGGPLLDSQGQLIGLNTMIYSKSGTYSGIGFAVPSNIVKRNVEQIIKFGKVFRPGIGIQVLSDSITRQLGIRGVVIAKVLPNTPAAKAGLHGTYRDQLGKVHLGDIIVSINGHKVKNYNDLYTILNKQTIGAKIHLIIMYKGKLRQVTLEVIKVP